MLRAMLCVSIVAVFPLGSAAAPRISEDVPIWGGTAGLARAAHLPSTPDRSRFVAELTRIIYEAPEKQRQDPDSVYSRVRLHLETAARVRAALVPFADGVSLSRAADPSDRDKLRELLQEAGLRLRENRGQYSVEAPNDREARARAAVVAQLGIDAAQLARALNSGQKAAVRMRSELAPLPLTADLWSKTIFDRPVTPDDLFAAVVTDERAALLSHGLAALDDATLQYMADHPAVLRQLHARAHVFAPFASHLRIRDGRVVTPASELGPEVESIWEALAGERTTTPERFVTALFERNAGRLAYLYDVVGELDAPRARLALGLAIKDPAEREVRARAFLEATSSSFAEWPTRERPFNRPLRDTAALLMAVEVDANGAPRAPAARLLWSRAFEGGDLPEDPSRLLRDINAGGSIDAAWIAEQVGGTDGLTRMARLNQLAFGFRVFAAADAAALSDVLVALRALPKYRSLLFGLEQIGIRRPALYAEVARQAERLSRLEALRAYLALSQFQGGLALIGRLAYTGSIDLPRAEALISSLAAAPLSGDGLYRGRILGWLRRDLLAGATDEGAEQTLVAGLSGAWTRRDGVTIQWEGETYRVDLAAAEESRIRMIRTRQAGYSLDHAFQLEAVAARLAAGPADLAQAKGVAAELQTLHEALPAKVRRTESDLMPGGAEDLPDPRALVDEAVRELGRITRPRDLRRAARVADDVFMAADVVAGEVFASLAYAISLGDPDGPSLLGGDVARRHDFGIGSRVSDVRALMPWATPEPHADPGVPWHVSGSLVGLDVALAQLSFHRVSSDAMVGPPTVSSNDRETFARSVALLNPYTLRNEDRDAIVLAITRGRQRVIALKSGADADVVAEAVKMDGWRRRALAWTLENQPAQKLSLFSLTELLVLGGGFAGGGFAGGRFAGGGSEADLDRWGAAMTPVVGCFCTRMPAPNTWRFAIGRPQIGLLGTAVPDLTLRIALALAELDLPASLAKWVLDAALPEYLDTVKPTDPSDWLTLVRGVHDLSRERIEDYVAAAAVVGGPLVPARRNSSRP